MANIIERAYDNTRGILPDPRRLFYLNFCCAEYPGQQILTGHILPRLKSINSPKKKKGKTFPAKGEISMRNYVTFGASNPQGHSAPGQPASQAASSIYWTNISGHKVKIQKVRTWSVECSRVANVNLELGNGTGDNSIRIQFSRQSRVFGLHLSSAQGCSFACQG